VSIYTLQSVSKIALMGGLIHFELYSANII